METPHTGNATQPALDIVVEESIATITLNRPAVRNAFDAALIADLTVAVRDLGARDDLRALVLRGAGPSFCAGADLRWMRASMEWDVATNQRDALALATLFETIATCPLAVIGAVHGAALGGGAGLVATCDLVIAAAGTTFGFTEVRLGLIPATIAPYVVARIGPGQTRALFVTGQRFDAERALAIGLVHQVVPPSDLDAALATTLAALRASGPRAIREAKALVTLVAGHGSAEVMTQTAAIIARIRTSPEAREGVGAFLEKRTPVWPVEAQA